MKVKPSPSTPTPTQTQMQTPLQILKPDDDEEEDSEVNGCIKNELQIVLAAPPFSLPDDWIVEEKRRSMFGSNPGKIDRYYTEPLTGKRFPSLLAVERHLRESELDTPMRKPSKSSNKCTMHMRSVPRIVRATGTSPFILPDDWIIEKKKRSSGKSAHLFDKYYIEPETGQRFRSLVAVERYLREEKEDTMLLKEFKCANKVKHSLRHGLKKDNISSKESLLEDVKEFTKKAKENITLQKTTRNEDCSRHSEHSRTSKKINFREKDNASMDDFGHRPSNINWVLSAPGGNMWQPFMGESLVPDSVKQRWSELFISSIRHNEKLPF